ncbi:MAG: diguanylate cyclase [Desulfobacteraceae bacterium]|nr:diguanylate cyclase [Desulfobacteraceae bacterium]MBC2755714.1 diguanylate cyclase [Desulfobacteraceae bacterium]
MKILIVDDTPHMRFQLKILLEAGGFTHLVIAQSAEEAFQYLGFGSSRNTNKGIELILMDIIMPGTDGIEACRRIKSHENFMDIPIIMVTGETSSESLQAAFDAGANDYVNKPLKAVELIARIKLHLKLKQEINFRKAREKELMDLTKQIEETNIKLQTANESLKHTINIDVLTEVASRRYFFDLIDREWKRTVRLSQPVSVNMIDIDFFKAFNDTYGHQKGDVCLKQIAKALEQSLKRPLDIVARYGGEEFIALLPDTDRDGAIEVAKTMQTKVAELGILHDSSQIDENVTISIGIATMVPDRNTTFSALIELADKALYLAKSKGRNRIEISKESV